MAFRDIKPGNILFDAEFNPKPIDLMPSHEIKQYLIFFFSSNNVTYYLRDNHSKIIKWSIFHMLSMF